MILCDIGNTTVDIYANGESRKVAVSEFCPESMQGEIWYISVNAALSESLKIFPNWHDMADMIDWGKYYPTMGIDRIMVCEAVDEGVIVDAGSAITVDVMSGGLYQGGFIALGLRSAAEAYGKLSSALSVSFNFEVDLTIMAKNTPDAVTVGFLAPLIEKIESLGKPLYLTGGDAPLLSRFFREAAVEENLIFRGMEKLLHKGSKC